MYSPAPCLESFLGQDWQRPNPVWLGRVARSPVRRWNSPGSVFSRSFHTRRKAHPNGCSAWDRPLAKPDCQGISRELPRRNCARWHSPQTACHPEAKSLLQQESSKTVARHCQPRRLLRKHGKLDTVLAPDHSLPRCRDLSEAGPLEASFPCPSSNALRQFATLLSGGSSSSVRLS